MKPDELSESCTGTINKTVASDLEGKHTSKTIPSCDKLEMYEETSIFIPINIKKESVESVS